MTKSLAHLFDHDSVVINRAETIIDRLLEILETPESRLDELRDTLLGFVCTKAILIMIGKCPDDLKEEAKTKVEQMDMEFFNKMKRHFTEYDVQFILNNALKQVLEEKFIILKVDLTPKQNQEFEELISFVGKF